MICDMNLDTISSKLLPLCLLCRGTHIQYRQLLMQSRERKPASMAMYKITLYLISLPFQHHGYPNAGAYIRHAPMLEGHF